MATTHHPNLTRARLQSEASWLHDLSHLFNNRNEFYPDVKYVLERKSSTRNVVWAHRALIRARSVSLYTHTGLSEDSPTGVLERSIDHHIRRMLLDWLEIGYTAAGPIIDDDSSVVSAGSVDAGDRRVQSLRNDLGTMLLQKYHPDLRVTRVPSNRQPQASAPTSSWSLDCHRFMLAARSPPSSYLRNFFASTANQPPGTLIQLRLAADHFTVASLEAVVQYIYTGEFAEDEDVELETALWTMHSAKYLGLESLRAYAEAYVVEVLMHGLFDAYAVEQEPESYGSSGCDCATCRARVISVLGFSAAEENAVLIRGAVRALVRYFGPLWISRELAELPPLVLAQLGDSVQDQVNAQNVVQMVHARDQIFNGCTEPWAGPIMNTLQRGSRTINAVLCAESSTCLRQDTWINLIRHNHYGSGDELRRIQRILDLMMAGIDLENATDMYEAITHSISRCPNVPSSSSRPQLPPKAAALHNMRERITDWITLQWRRVRDVGGFASIDASTRRDLAAAIGCSEADLMRRSRRSNTISGTSGSQVSSLLALYNPATTPVRDESSSMRRNSGDRSPYLGPFQSDLDLPSPTMQSYPPPSPPRPSHSSSPPSRNVTPTPQSRGPSMDEGPRRRWSPTPSITAQYESRFIVHAQRANTPPVSPTSRPTTPSPIATLLNPLRRLTTLNLGNRISNVRIARGGHVRSRSLSALMPVFGRSATRPSVDGRPETSSGPSNAVQGSSSGASARNTFDSSVNATEQFPLCIVCMDSPRDMVFQDCGHMVACQACCNRIVQTDPRCPSCRKVIRGVPRRVYG